MHHRGLSNLAIMTPRQYQRILDLYEKASALSNSDRERFLQSECADDAYILARIRAMLDIADLSLENTDLPEIDRSIRAVAAGVSQYAGKLASAAPLTGARLGKYELIDLIGEGGMGAVYRARQDHPRRIVAIKIIRTALASPELVRRFEREAETLGRLHHPGIAHVYEAGLAQLKQPATLPGKLSPAPPRDGIDTTLDASAQPVTGSPLPTVSLPQPYIAMEYVRGIPLLHVIRERKWSVRRTLSFMARVCDAVQHAHAAGVIHRDLKPGNILVVTPGENAHATRTDTISMSVPAQPLAFAEEGDPKVLDFGIARIIGSEDTNTTLQTEVGQLIGTLPYMSPEQIAGDSRQLDARTDVYSIGVILYELLAGRLPYDIRHCSVPEAARIIREEDPSRLSKTASRWRSTEFDRDVETIVMKAMEKDRARRYASAAELAADIRRFLRDEPIVARPTSGFYQFRKFTKRHRALVFGTLATFLALTSGLVASLLLYRQSLAARQTADFNAEIARQNEQQAQWLAYQSGIAAAMAALLNHDIVIADANLDRAPPALRGWEWRFFKNRVDQSYASSFVTPTVSVFSDLSVSSADQSLWCLIGRWPWYPSLEVFNLESAQLTQSLGFPDARTAAISSSATYLAMFHADQTIRVLQLPEMRTVHVWHTRNGASLLYGDMAISDDGRWLVFHAGDRDKGFPAVTERVDLHSGAHRICEMPFGTRLRVNARGDILIGDREVPEIIVWRDDDDSWVRLRAGDGNIRAIAFSPDGSRFATGGFDNAIRIWDTDSLACLAIGRGHRDCIEWIEFSFDGKSLISGSQDRTIRVWDLPSLAPRSVLNGHRGRVGMLAVSADGQRLASLDLDGRLLFWNPADVADREVLRGHTSYVYSVAYSPDGRRLASGGWDRTIRIWDVATRRLVHVLFTNIHIVDRLAFGEDDRCLIAHGRFGDDRRLTQWWDAREGKLLGEAENTSWPPLLTTHDDRELAVAIDLDTRIAQLWNPSTGAIRAAAVDLREFRLSGNFHAPRELDLRVLMHDERELYVRDARTSAWVHLQHASWSGHYRIAPPALETPLVAAPEFSTNDILVWNLNDLRLVARLSGHTDEVFSVAWSPDGSRLASAGRDQMIRLWDSTTWEEVAQLHGHTSYVWSLEFSPDGSQIVSASGDYTVRIWDTQPQHEQPAPPEHPLPR